MKQSRMIHFDILRVLACFSVVVLHSAAMCWYYIPIDSMDWLIVNSYNAIVRFGVPIFVMISGALFLVPEKKLDLKRLYSHNVLRLIIIYIVWSAVYGIYDCELSSWSVLTLNDILTEVYEGRYHLWYLPMIVGFYMLIPILKKWLENAEKKDVQYFLCLFLVFQIGQKTIMALKPMEWLGFLWKTVDLQELVGYLGYFILGYYLVRYQIDSKWHKWIYFAGIFGAFANIGLSYYKTMRLGYAFSEIYDSFGFFTFLMVVAIFHFCVEKLPRLQLSERKTGIIKELSMATLGIYLMHIAWMEFFQSKGIHSTIVPPIVGVPLVALMCFVLSYICAALLRRIPIVGKYIC